MEEEEKREKEQEEELEEEETKQKKCVLVLLYISNFLPSSLLFWLPLINLIDDTVRLVQTHCLGLALLFVQYCPAVNMSAILALRHYRPTIKVLTSHVNARGPGAVLMSPEL